MSAPASQTLSPQAEMLAQLRDIHAAPPPGWWPPAPGWWVLAALLLAVLGWLGWRAWQRAQVRRRREALARVLHALVHDHERPLPDRVAAINRLLKQVAFERFGVARVAALHGSGWTAFLHETSPEGVSDGWAAPLADAPYREHPAAEPVDWIDQAQRWVMQHG